MTSTKLQEGTFIPKLKSDSLPEKAIIVEEEILIDESNLSWEFKKLENITFESKLIISSVNIKSGLVFINCNFRKGVEFLDIKTDFMISHKNPFNYSILFNNCKGNYIGIFESHNISRGLLLENECLFDKVSIIRSRLSEIKIRNSKINKLLDLSIVKSNEIRLDENHLKEHFRIESLEGDISLISNTFNNWVKFWNIKTNRSLALNKNTFNDEFKIEASKIKGFFIHEDTFNKQFLLENRDTSGGNHEAYCKEIFITKAKFLEGADFKGLGKEINKITLRLSPGLEGVLNFEGWNLENLQVSGINQNLKLLFKKMNFKVVLFNNFTNYADLSFDKCSAIENSTLNFLNTNFGSARFNEFDLATFNVILIDNVSLDSVKVSNVKWFENSQLEIGSNPTEEETQRGIRELSRQLKYALSSSGNQIDSLLFKAREMQAYRNELRTKGKSYSIFDRIIMSVNMSNDYGLNWWKPVLIIFFITLSFYILMLPLFSTAINYKPGNSFADISNTFIEFWNNFNVFWQMFNPARKFSETYGNVSSGLLYFFDLIHRIVLGIFIFQIIKGFRKFSLR